MQSMRTEGFFGAVYGFGLSVAVLALTSADRWLDATVGSLAALAVAAGPLRVRLPRGWRLTAPLPFALAAAALAGAHASILVAAAAGVGTGLVALRSSGGWNRGRAASFHAGASAIAAAVAALTVRLVDLGRPGWDAPVATGVWLLAWSVAQGSLAAAAVVLVTDLRGWRPVARVAWDETRSCALQLPFGLALPFVVGPRWGVPALGGAFAALLLYRFGRPPLVRALRGAPDAAEPTIYRSITSALARALAAGDETTADHLERVKGLCTRIGTRLGLSRTELEALGAAALLHDVGRIAVPDRVRAKAGRLTRDELRQVRVHPAVGAEIVRAIRFPYPVHSIVRHHRERWNGSGYPDGLHGEEIPLGARILAAVHAYDALISPRPYRAAMNHDDALRTLRAESGQTFDPLVVDLLAEELDRERCRREPPGADTRPDAEERADVAATRMTAAVRRLEMSYAIRRVVASELPTRDVLTVSLRRLADDVSYDAAAIWSVAEATRDAPVFADGIGREWLAGAPLGADGGTAAASLRDRSVVYGATRWTAACRRADGSIPAALDEVDHAAGIPIVLDDAVVGVIGLYRRARPFDDDDRLAAAGAAAALAGAVTGPATSPARDVTLTDLATGLPNATFLRFEATHRFTADASRSGRCGVIAIRLVGLAELLAVHGQEGADRALVRAGRRVATTLAPGETLVRHGADTLVVLTPSWRPDRLVRRANDLEHVADDRALRARAAHVAFPFDGDRIDTLLRTLGRRLDESGGRARAVVPFRRQSVRAS